MTLNFAGVILTRITLPSDKLEFTSGCGSVVRLNFACLKRKKMNYSNKYFASLPGQRLDEVRPGECHLETF
jgi:hypothetical protein